MPTAERGAGGGDADELVQSPLRCCGMNSITSTPTSGRKVPTAQQPVLIGESFHGFRVALSYVDEDEDDGADRGGAEQQRAVLADLAGLGGLQALTGLARRPSRSR